MFEIWRNNRRIDRNHRLYRAEMEKAKKEGWPSEKIRRITFQFAEEKLAMIEEIHELVTRHLLRKASQLFLPFPEYSDESMWIRSESTGSRYLSAEGITKMRNLIRDEEAARRRAFLDRTSPFIGIIGATTGLLAIILTMT